MTVNRPRRVAIAKFGVNVWLAILRCTVLFGIQQTRIASARAMHRLRQRGGRDNADDSASNQRDEVRATSQAFAAVGSVVGRPDLLRRGPR